jgi:ATP-binding cassette, subfamily B, bacterial HlyB/CyaB
LSFVTRESAENLQLNGGKQPAHPEKPMDGRSGDAEFNSATESETAFLRLSGLSCLKLLLNFHQIPAELDQLKHALGGNDDIGMIDLVRLGSQLGAKSRIVEVRLDKLERQPMPCIVKLAAGDYAIVGKIEGGKVLVHSPIKDRSGVFLLTEFATRWLGQETVLGQGNKARGEVLLLTTRESIAGNTRRFDVTWFIPALVKYRHLIGQVLLASLFIQLLALISPILFQVVIDKVLVHRTLSTLEILFVAFLGVSIFEFFMGAGRTWLFSHTTSRIDVELGAKLYKHLLGLPMAYFSARRVGDSVARVRELETIREFLTSSSVTVVIDGLFTVVFLAVMYVYSPTLFLVVLVSLPIYVLILWLLAPVLKRRLDEKFQRGADNQAFLVETVTNVETAKAMAVEPALQQRWEKQIAGYVQSSFKALQIANWGSEAIQLVSKLCTAIILFVGAKLVMDNKLTVGELVAFNMFAGRVSGPVLRLAQLAQQFSQVKIAIDRLGDILNTPTEPQFNPSRATLPTIKGVVNFEGVTFRYTPQGQEVLRNIYLTIGAGERLGIVGSSGSGKSTLTKLIQRLHVPDEGRVLVDGVDLAQVDPSWLRRQVGVVLQENRLFNRTVRDNIALADPAASMAAIEQAARLAGAHEFILALPEGYDTMVSEGGMSLSGGQRQRIAIARALLTNPRILILDEATSALDAESEEIIQANLNLIAKQRTMIIIAHRLSAVRSCDRIITIEKGKIIEEGSHDELLALGGRYAQLYAKQMGTERDSQRNDSATSDPAGVNV